MPRRLGSGPHRPDRNERPDWSASCAASCRIDSAAATTCWVVAGSLCSMCSQNAAQPTLSE